MTDNIISSLSSLTLENDPDVRDYYESFGLKLSPGYMGYEGSLDDLRKRLQETLPDHKLPEGARLIWEEWDSSSAGLELWWIIKDNTNMYTLYSYENRKNAIMGATDKAYMDIKLHPRFSDLMEPFLTFDTNILTECYNAHMEKINI